MDQPPVLQVEPVPEPKARLGRIGLYVSLAPLAMLAVLMLAKPG